MDLAPKFEVFPILVTAEAPQGNPEQVIDCKGTSGDLSIAVLRKADWSVPTALKDRAQLLGDPVNSTTQYEGRATDVPSDALDSALVDAGVEVRSATNWSFLVATSMFPFALYVSDCDFSEAADSAIYERLDVD